MNHDYAALLFTSPGFLRELGQAIDLGATRNVYDDSDSPASADEQALRSDWISVGKDLGLAMTDFGKRHPTKR